MSNTQPHVKYRTHYGRHKPGISQAQVMSIVIVLALMALFFGLLLMTG